jgi:drug/metabolite transporter (DMT)-like permease
VHLEPGPLVVALVLVAAVLHATWNAVAHAALDRLVGFASISLATLVCGGVLVLTSPALDRHHLGLAALSASLHLAYLLLLWLSYEHGDLSRSYPVARGSGVALVAAASFLLPRSPTGPAVLVGVALVVGGLAGVAVAGGGGSGRGLLAALATGVAIAGYTVVDGLAVSGGAEVAAYAGWIFLLQSWPLPLAALALRGRRLLRVPRRQVLTALAGGVVSLVAYGLVLVAQTSGALAAVAALRELSIAVGVVLGAFVLHEPAARRRLLPAVVLTAGAVVLALSIA